ncbi:MAG: YciI family protein [Pseudomonadales bacterium]
MRYLLLIWENEAISNTLSEAEQAAMMQEYFAITEDARTSGILLGGDPLLPSETATTVRVRNGAAVSTDGPFAETREQLGGYYMLDCATLDDALAFAARIPAARHGAVEVRPIMELDA